MGLLVSSRTQVVSSSLMTLARRNDKCMAVQRIDTDVEIYCSVRDDICPEQLSLVNVRRR